jgi:kynureninase
MTKHSFDSTELKYAKQLDETDPLRSFRNEFLFPTDKNGKELVYLCGNSLGLQPKEAINHVLKEIEDWKNLGVKGHFNGDTPWTKFHELLAEPMAEIVGALPEEVVVMNTLTVNLHLMMVSFYRPTGKRFKVLMEKNAFPSDKYAVASQLRFHGFDPHEGVIELSPRPGEYFVRHEDILSSIEENGDDIALILIGNPNYYSGQTFKMKEIAKKGHSKGCKVGFDCAHGAGNIPLELHDSGVDFAVWCTYKYLNSGPGSISGAFVHQRHITDNTLPKFTGWWGYKKETRFLMEDEFDPIPTVESWQLSNAPILSMAPIIASCNLFVKAGIQNLRSKSIKLTGYLEFLLSQLNEPRINIITPVDPSQRGCQLSIQVKEGNKSIFNNLSANGVIVDWREPDVIRVAPAPIYNSFEDVHRFTQILEHCLKADIN